MSPDKGNGRVASVEDLRGLMVEETDEGRARITICAGTGCIACGAEAVIETVHRKLLEQGLDGQVEVKTTGCLGPCEMGTLMTIQPGGIFYPRVNPQDVERIVRETAVGGRVVEDLLYVDPATGEKVEREEDVPFYGKQERILIADNGRLDPTDIHDYFNIGGYQALGQVLEGMSPDEVIETVIASGLRGRGGAGFPAGLKWKSARVQETRPKYLVCNADEGDPGAYMDRGLLEGNPHRVIEGMCIGAYAIGAESGFVYVRHEYPLAVRHVRRAIEDARKRGLLGEDILGTGFSFDLKAVRGAGAFVCGEETALIASLEGRKGEPRQRPPFPSVAGFRRKPTVINNVETWSNVPLIVRNGADWFTGIGSEKSKGTKIFSLVGKVINTGLVEVPMGTTLRQIVFDIGGGIPNGGTFKAVQTGGPAGGCVPASLLDLPIDFEALHQAGTIMGSGGLIVMDESTCMVDVARYFTRFLEEESCGKCYSCRKGTQRMREILDDICEGRGTMGQLDLLEELGRTVNMASMCGLGQNAATPVLSVLRYFREEFEEHIRDHRCSAGVCTELIRFEIQEALCDGCHACSKVCPTDAITGEKDAVHVIDQSVCIRCGSCQEVCAKEAVLRLSGVV